MLLDENIPEYTIHLPRTHAQTPLYLKSFDPHSISETVVHNVLQQLHFSMHHLDELHG